MEIRTALVCIAKGENRYIREWCEWHKDIGFDKIYIYDNNIGSEKIKDTVGDLPYVDVNVRYRGVQQRSVEIQLKCYNEWYKMNRAKFTHFAFLDCDEFLNISDEYDGLKDYISKVVRNADCVKLFWKCHTDNGHIRYEDKPVRERFPQIAEPKDGRYFYKMLFSTVRNDFRMINVHYSTPLTYVINCNGGRIKYSQTTYTRTEQTYGDAWIDHYITKSAEEYFMNKRGKKDDKRRLTVGFYFNVNEHTEEKDKYIAELLNMDVESVAKQTPTSTPVRTIASPALQTAGQKPNLEAPKPAPAQQVESKYADGISVCISAYQAQDFIEECLDSVKAQTWFKSHSNWEVLLGIDGCKETLTKVKMIIHKYRNLRVFMMDENVGTYVTCNTIMKQAKYKWLLRFDSDDIMLPNMVEELLKYTKNGNADMLLPHARNFGTMNNSIGTAHGCMLLRHTIFDTFGGYQPWRCAADTEIKKRLQRTIREKDCPIVLFKRRTHKNSLTSKTETNMLSPLRKKYHSQIRIATTTLSATIKTTTAPFTELGIDDGGVSICISAYKAQDFIEECLDSVEAQTWFRDHDNYEIILGIDECEETLAKVKTIMHKYRNLKVLMMDSNKGTYITTNTIMKQAKYKWLLRFDSDDVMMPNMVEELMADTDKGDILLMGCQYFGLNNKLRKSTNGITMQQKEIFDKFGGYQPWKCAADSEMLKRLKNIITEYNTKKILFLRRVHNESLTQKKGDTQLFDEKGVKTVGSEREQYRKYTQNLKVTKEEDAIIECVTNSFKEIKL